MSEFRRQKRSHAIDVCPAMADSELSDRIRAPTGVVSVTSDVGTGASEVLLQRGAMTSSTLSGTFDTSELPKIASEPVTVTVARTIEPGREADFETWAAHVADRVLEFEGCLGVGILKPGEPSGPYQIVFRFIDALSLRVWERSPQRRLLLAEVDEMVIDIRVQRTVGVEDWFSLAQRAEPKRPLWKRILLDVVWVYPVAVLISAVVAPWLVSLPLVLRTLVSAATISVIMRLAIGPVRSRLHQKRRFG